MKKIAVPALTTAALLLMTQAASAHPGHDHTGIPGGIFHKLTGLNLLITAALSVGIILVFSKHRHLARFALGASILLAGLLLSNGF